MLDWRLAQEMLEQLAYPHGEAVRLLQDGVDGAIGAPRVVVKDLLDVAGLVTTGGSAALADDPPALTDAAVVARLRANGAAIVLKTALQELGRGTSGVNAWSGTPCNPLSPRLVPGGSSSRRSCGGSRGGGFRYRDGHSRLDSDPGGILWGGGSQAHARSFEFARGVALGAKP